MKNLKIIIIVILVTAFSSCKKETQKSTKNLTETEEINVLDTLSLKMNNGKKWIVNNATQIGVTKMDSIIDSFKSYNKDGYVKLGNDLSKQTNFIIKSCDMTGEAHDQLHVVLVPMLDEISNLKESNSVVKSKIALNQLEALIDSYFSHFSVE